MHTDEAITKAKPTPAYVELAYAYYPILLELAMQNRRMTYGELVTCAKERYPNNNAVQNAISVTAGKVLNELRIFTDEFEIPDLSCLIYSKATGECAGAYTKNFDPVEARRKVAEFEWNKVATDFESFIERRRIDAAQGVKPIRLPKPKSINKDAAAKIRWEYYLKNINEMPQEIKQLAEYIDSLIIQGMPAEEAFIQAIKKLAA